MAGPLPLPEPDEFDSLTFSAAELAELERTLQQPGPSNISAYNISRSPPRQPPVSKSPQRRISSRVMERRAPSPASSEHFDGDEVFEDEAFMSTLTRQMSQIEENHPGARSQATATKSNPASSSGRSAGVVIRPQPPRSTNTVSPRHVETVDDRFRISGRHWAQARAESRGEQRRADASLSPKRKSSLRRSYRRLPSTGSTSPSRDRDRHSGSSPSKTFKDGGTSSQLAWLDGFEDGLSCTICSDYFVYPTMISCGHTFCAPCITKWRKTPGQTYRPTCPTCRSAITIPTSSLALSTAGGTPNFALEALLEKHLQLLGRTGVEGWAKDGSGEGEARREWEKKRSEWKYTLDSATRPPPPVYRPPPAAPAHRAQPQHPPNGTVPLLRMMFGVDPNYDDDLGFYYDEY